MFCLHKILKARCFVGVLLPQRCLQRHHPADSPALLSQCPPQDLGRAVPSVGGHQPPARGSRDLQALPSHQGHSPAAPSPAVSHTGGKPSSAEKWDRRTRWDISMDSRLPAGSRGWLWRFELLCVAAFQTRTRVSSVLASDGTSYSGLSSSTAVN